MGAKRKDVIAEDIKKLIEEVNFKNIKCEGVEVKITYYRDNTISEMNLFRYALKCLLNEKH